MNIIYKTTNLVNGKIYVGQHYTSADDGYLGSGNILIQSIKKYGKENFIREILEHCNLDNVNEREIYWITLLNAMNRKIGIILLMVELVEIKLYGMMNIFRRIYEFFKMS